MELFIAPGSFFPEISPEVQLAIRALFGWLLFGTLLITLPNWRWFFVSERWGGYTKSTPLADLVGHPAISSIICVLWHAVAILIAVGVWVVPATLINLIFCYYYFIHMRWGGLLRGMGAPGFMIFWLAMGAFLLEFSTAYARDLRPLVLLVLQVDFALIMLSAGVSKLVSGYPHNHGMELGLVNPMWSYWPKFFVKMSPNSWIIRFENQMAWSVEIIAVVLMIIPGTRLLGGLAILLSFVFVRLQIRLGLLAEMVILCCFLFFHPGSFADLWIKELVPAAVDAAPQTLNATFHAIMFGMMWGYFLLRPVVLLGLWYNYILSRRLWEPLQRALELYTNLFGIILWRVFTIDVVNFYIQIYHQPAKGGERVKLSRYESPWDFRFNHVAESITVTTIFTALRYFPNNPEIFRERLLRYVRTLPAIGESKLVFQFVNLDKSSGRFLHRPVMEFEVDPISQEITERVLDPELSVRSTEYSSPLHESGGPGTYAPPR